MTDSNENHDGTNALSDKLDAASIEALEEITRKYNAEHQSRIVDKDDLAAFLDRQKLKEAKRSQTYELLDIARNVDTSTAEYAALQAARLEIETERDSLARRTAMLKRRDAGSGPSERAKQIFTGRYRMLLQLAGAHPDNGKTGANRKEYTVDLALVKSALKASPRLGTIGPRDKSAMAVSYLYNGSLVPAQIPAHLTPNGYFVDDFDDTSEPVVSIEDLVGDLRLHESES